MEFDHKQTKMNNKNVKWDGLASFILNGRTEYELLVDKIQSINEDKIKRRSSIVYDPNNYFN